MMKIYPGHRALAAVCASSLFSALALMSTSLTAAGSYQLPGGAADYADPYIAAGFRALFTCSAHFAMARPLGDILRVELADTSRLELPAPTIDEERLLVRAEDGQGNRVTAVFRDSMGCTVVPPHWSDSDIPRLPYAARVRSSNDPELEYPLGDRATPAPTGTQQKLIDTAFDDERFGSGTLTAGVLVIHHGRIVAEQYRSGFGPLQGYRTWSTAKSISASLIAIAASEGIIDLEGTPAIPGWQGPGDPRRMITWKQLLWMSSGLWSGGANTYAVYFGGQDTASGASTTPLEATPGERWKYANNDTLLLLLGLRQALGNDLDYLRYPYDKLFNRIGMHHTWMETDHLGNFIGSSQVYTTARDLGRFAQLYLQDGIWEGERILPEGWTRFAATPAPAFPARPGEQGYGAQFWLLGGVEGLPADAYTTSGNKGQHATIIPSADMVVVRTGVDPLGVRWNHPRFVRQVLEAFAD